MSQVDSMFDGGCPLRPPFEEKQLARVPAGRGVLLMETDQCHPILLITGADLRRRARSRLIGTGEGGPSKRADLRQVVRRVRWRRTHSTFETDLWYLRIARSLWPRGYAQMLSWKPAWFIHVDPEEDFPHVRVGRRVFERSGAYFGPFPSGRSAQRFVEELQAAFRLCRDFKRLVRAPDGRRCTYGQMGKCLCPCDGTLSMSEYRRVVLDAAGFVGGDRQVLRQDLTERMRQASKALAFEEAAAVKHRLESLERLEAEEYRWVAPAERFQFMIVQPGPTRGEARVFQVDRDRILTRGDLAYPPSREQCEQILEGRLAGPTPGESDISGEGQSGIGLVARCLFSSPQRQGVVVRWTDRSTPEALLQAVDRGADRLRLGRSKSRRAAEGSGR